MAVTENRIIRGPWIEELVRQYRARAQVLPTSRLGLALAVIAAAIGLLAPLLLHLDSAAYPRNPEKQQALEACRRADPTFVRFSAGDRDACYDRFHRSDRAVLAAQPQ